MLSELNGGFSSDILNKYSHIKISHVMALKFRKHYLIIVTVLLLHWEQPAGRENVE